MQLKLRKVCASGKCRHSLAFVLFLIWLQLLERNVSQRLGCRPHGQGFQDIQNHAWLQGVDWEVLDMKEVQPPFVPDVSIVQC
jgi:hypothetical protein